MELHVYRITRNWSAIPIMVLAEYEEHAIELHDAFCRTHFPSRFDIDEYPSAHELDERELEDHPQLAELIEDSGPGIAFWIAHEEGWHTGKPEGPMLGRLAPPDTPVRYYVFESDDGDDAEVFAVSGEDALLIYYAYHEAAFARRPSKVTFKERSRFTLLDGRAALRDDMDAGLTGVAGWTLTEGWRVYPPEHALAGE